MTNPGTEQSDRSRRRALNVVWLLIGCAVGSVLAVVLVALIGPVSAGSMHGSDSAPGTTAAGGTGRAKHPGVGAMGAMTAEDALRFHIPVPVKRHCSPGDAHDVESFSYFSLVCHPGQPLTLVQYSSFHDADALREKFARDRQTMAGNSVRHAQTCSTLTRNAYGRYWMEEGSRAEHRVTGRPMPGTPRGRLMCYFNGNHATIEWYDSDTHIFAWASASQDLTHQLFRWWMHDAGPWHPRAHSGGM